MKIGVVGLGFVGLTTALGFAEKGINTLGYDLDLAKLHQINENKIPFYEPELSNALKRQLGNNFNVTDNISNLVKKFKYYIYLRWHSQGDRWKCRFNSNKERLKGNIKSA